MAIADSNHRHKVTIPKTLLKVIESNAEELGLSVSETMAMAIESYYADNGKYTPEDTQWKKKLKNRAA